MTVLITSHQRPRRAGLQRSRNGCLTCKYDRSLPLVILDDKLTESRIRRVKCDETVPHCRKCTESGRKCEGPIKRQIQFVSDQPNSRSTTPSPPGEISLLAPQHPDDERRAFHFFTQFAGPVFSGVLDGRFWMDLIPKLAHTYSFIWDSVVSISTLLEHVDYMSLQTTFDPQIPTKITNREHRKALKIYGRAITDVRRLIERGTIDDSVIALSYLLFGSIEFQQRNVKVGSTLVKQCCKILRDNLESLHIRQPSPAAQAVHEVLTPLMARKAAHMATLGDTLPPQWSAENSASGTLNSFLADSPALNAARIRFHALAYRCYEAVRLTDLAPNVSDSHPDKVFFMQQRTILMDDLMEWKASFVAATNRAPDNPETDWVASYLMMYWAVCYIALGACTSNFQTVYDEYTDLFTETIHHAAICLKHRYAEGTRIDLPPTFEAPLLPTLYFCATKCRDPVLRRRALSLMRQAPPQAASWAFIAPHREVAKFIAVEERGVDNEMSTGIECPGSKLPPEERRFAYSSVVGRLTAAGRYRRALELCRFESRSDGSRRLITEFVWLDDWD